MAAAADPRPVVIQWIVDTRNLWPEAAETRHLETHPGASRALAILPEAERAAVLKYVFVRDARMSLASHLLKHYVVARYSRTPARPEGVPWRDTVITRDARSKPVYVDPATGAQPVAFNVSHQAGVVALAAVVGYERPPGAATTPTPTPTPTRPAAAAAPREAVVDIGIDVVSPGERRARDHALVSSDGWPAFVDMHSDVFSPREASFLKYAVLSSPSAPGPGQARTPEDLLDYKLRCFYTLWCLREAYVKMTGEALLAPWLRELEFRNFRPPTRPGGGGAAVVDVEDLGGGGVAEDEETGTAVREHEIWFKDGRVDDANVCMRSLGPDFMVCTAVRTPANKADGLGFELARPFEAVTIGQMVAFAEAQM